MQFFYHSWNYKRWRKIIYSSFKKKKWNNFSPEFFLPTVGKSGNFSPCSFLPTVEKSGLKINKIQNCRCWDSKCVPGGPFPKIVKMEYILREGLLCYFFSVLCDLVNYLRRAGNLIRIIINFDFLFIIRN